MVSLKSDLQVRDDGFRAKKIAVTPRIGISKSVERPLRYVVAENHFVSGKN
jgi:3-methyladenine DNA glycosylase Mpg